MSNQNSTHNCWRGFRSYLSYCFLNDKYFKDYSILIIDKGKQKSRIIIFHLGNQLEINIKKQME